jgi:hypothetical protein
LDRHTSASGDLPTLPWTHLDIVNRRADGDITKWQRIANLDVCLRPRLYEITNRELRRSQDIPLLAIKVVKERYASIAIRIVLDRSDFCWNLILIPFEIDNTILPLVATATMSRCLTTV